MAYGYEEHLINQQEINMSFILRMESNKSSSMPCIGLCKIAFELRITFALQNHWSRTKCSVLSVPCGQVCVQLKAKYVYSKRFQ